MNNAPALGDFVYPARAARINVLPAGEHAARRAVLIAAYAITAYKLKPEYNVSLAVPTNNDAKIIEHIMFGVGKKPKPDLYWVKAARRNIIKVSQIGWGAYIAAQVANPPMRSGSRRPAQLYDVTLNEANDHMLPVFIHGVTRQSFPSATMPLRVVKAPVAE